MLRALSATTCSYFYIYFFIYLYRLKTWVPINTPNCNPIPQSLFSFFSLSVFVTPQTMRNRAGIILNIFNYGTNSPVHDSLPLPPLPVRTRHLSILPEHCFRKPRPPTTAAPMQTPSSLCSGSSTSHQLPDHKPLPPLQTSILFFPAWWLWTTLFKKADRKEGRHVSSWSL